jgi:KaiC/GvpD/RAD55 family RecA-like ATPase
VAKRKGKAARESFQNGWFRTAIPGFDELMERGIPRGKNILVAGGPGTGKTIFCLQTLYNAARRGEDCLYITMEESPASLVGHMKGFGWPLSLKKTEENEHELLIRGSKKGGRLLIHRQDPFRIARSVEALLAKAAGHLRVRLEALPEIIPSGFRPSSIALDSVSALQSAFVGKPESYRIYIEQLFRLFERANATTFLITETEEAPARLSPTGVEEFLADGVFVLYYIKSRDTRVRAIEVLKLRGAKHENSIVPFIITPTGIEVFPNERIYEVG